MEKDKERMRHKRRKETERRDNVNVNVSRLGGSRCVTCIGAVRSCDSRGESPRLTGITNFNKNDDH